ncbi:MAG: NADH-quinone oxidoreductase subunit NuoN [Actinomycetaceae bacterium]|nr:NADH-quinone oxidoreductase subunit NuoN [Arcanobacterium sp.]MDD7505011.1 NADH-quinone oxidoreductase subunit NuoN [Actinomycetaceae bacterium]MDY6143332.1 NADH-quinone oxidoreductase subunit NuoN [Arcanobacterium sp.]
MTQITDWLNALPLIVVLGAAVVSTLVEAFVPRGARRVTQIVISLLALVVALVSLVWRGTVAVTASTEQGASGVGIQPIMTTGAGTELFGINLVQDAFSILGQAVILISAILAFLVIADRSENRDGAFTASAATRPGSQEEHESTVAGRVQTEIFPLALFATGGMMAFTSAFDLLTLFISLEVLSLPLYVLCATARRKRLLSQEAAMKYFILGAFSSAIFLMGAAFLYGATGTLFFNGISQNTMMFYGDDADVLFAVGAIMLTVGLLFKIGAVPFHAWTPDVYQGAPSPITGFMAAGTKVAAFIALLRVTAYFALPVSNTFTVFLWIVIIATIVVGTVLGMVQNDVKRMLAYSSIAHAGFILIAIVSILGGQLIGEAVASLIFYLLSYGIASVGAFAIVTLVRDQDANGNVLGEATNMDSWAGLGKRSPILASAMLVFLLSFAGIPLTAGFIGKFEVFRVGVFTGNTVLVVIAVLASAATAFFYFRLVRLMFFQDPVEGRVKVVESEGTTVVTIIVAVVLTILLGVFPDPIIALIQGTIA